MADGRADGEVVIQFKLDDQKAQKKLDTMNEKIKKLEAKLNESNGEQSGIKKELDAALESARQTEAALDSLKAKRNELKAIVSGDVASTPEDYFSAYNQQSAITEQIKTQEALLKEQNKDAQTLGTQYERITDKVIQQTEALNAAKTEAGEYVEKVTNGGDATEGMAKATNSVAESMDKFGKRIAWLVKRVLVFSLITRALQSLRKWLGKTIMQNEEARASVARLKAALLTLAQPILQVVIPAFTVLVNVLTRLVTLLARIVSKVFGTTYEKSAAAAKALYDEQEALEGVGSAAKKAEKSLASFDEINQLSDNSADSGAGGAGGVGSSSDIAPDFTSKIKDQLTGIAELFIGAGLLALGAILTFSGANIPLGLALMALGALAIYDAVTEDWGKITEILRGKIGEIVTIGSWLLLAIGVILAFSGANIPLGIGLMLAGATGLAAAVAANWDVLPELLNGTIGKVIGIGSSLLLVIGAILTFTGTNLPLGIGMMVVGAVGLATVAAVNWDSITTALQGKLGEIVELISKGLLAIGVVLAFTGNIPLGVALIAAGAAGLVAVAAVNWDEITQRIKDSSQAIFAILRAALLVIGAALVFSGANIPLGLAMMVVGAAGLVSSVMENWNAMPTKTQQAITAVTAVVGAALLVLGAILVFSGVGIPLGLALLVAGGASLTAAIAPNWNFILDKLKGCWTSIKGFWNKNIAPIFTAAWWRSLGVNALNGLIGAFEGAVNSIIDGINWLIAKLNTLQINIPDWIPLVGGQSFGINIPSVGRVQLPRLAEGAVIPPNREFMAVLGDQKSGTNIETPLATMVQAFRQAMAESGGMGGKQITVILEMDKREFGRAVYKANNDETQRVGVKLAGVRT